MLRESLPNSFSGREVINFHTIKPFDKELLAEHRKNGLKIVSMENGSVIGGFGESIAADLKFGWPDKFIEHGSIDELERLYRLGEASITEKNKENEK